MKNICRTCLQEIEDQSEEYKLDVHESNSEELTLRQQLTECVPELVLDITTNIVLCWSCTTALRCAYGFRQQCLESENRIRSYLTRTHSHSVDDLRQMFEKTNIEIETVEVSDETILEALLQRKPTNNKTVPKFNTKQNSATPSNATNGSNSNDTTVNKQTPSLLEFLLQSKPYNCKYCSYQTIKGSKFEIHQRTHAAEGFNCSTCDYSTKNEEEFNIHTKIHRAFDTLQCHNCEYETFSKSELMNHMQIHAKKRTLGSDQEPVKRIRTLCD